MEVAVVEGCSWCRYVGFLNFSKLVAMRRMEDGKCFDI